MRRMPIACWIPKATDILSEYEIYIALPRQQLLRELAPLLCYAVRILSGLLNHLHCIQR